MKRLTVFLDGTWQRLTQPDPTNITKLAQSVAHSDPNGVAQIVFYDAGVGAKTVTDKKVGRPLLAGITGQGLDENLTDAYQFLSWNYTTGDEIYIFGFSRGAFTARSLCGLIRNGGLLHRPYIDLTKQAYDHYRSKGHPDSAVQFRPARLDAERQTEIPRSTAFVACSGRPPSLFYRRRPRGVSADAVGQSG
jgi:uncharacterized protein (DUF2235 family)